jgi:hypothetical protein
MLRKEMVIDQIKDLPEKFSIDELMEKMLFLYKLEAALEQSKNKQITPHEEVKDQFKKWLQ